MNKLTKTYLKIDKLKQYLRDTDYQAIKYAEGEITLAVYQNIKDKRRSARAEINALETQLKIMKDVSKNGNKRTN